MKKLGSVIIFLAVLVPLWGEEFPIGVWYIENKLSPHYTTSATEALLIEKSGANILLSRIDNHIDFWLGICSSLQNKVKANIERNRTAQWGPWYETSLRLHIHYPEPLLGHEDSLAWWDTLFGTWIDSMSHYNDPQQIYSFYVFSEDFSGSTGNPQGIDTLCKKIKNDPVFQNCKTLGYGWPDKYFLSKTKNLDALTRIKVGSPPKGTSPGYAEFQTDVLDTLAKDCGDYSRWLKALNHSCELRPEIPIYKRATCRRPTEAEMRAMCNVSFAWGAKGFTFWCYGISSNYTGILDSLRRPFMPQDSVDSVFGEYLAVHQPDSGDYGYLWFRHLTKDLKVLGPVFRRIEWDTATSMKPIKADPWVNEWDEGLEYVKRVVWQDSTPPINIDSTIYGELALFRDSRPIPYPDYFFIVNRHTRPEDTVELSVWLGDNYAGYDTLWGIDMLKKDTGYTMYIGYKDPILNLVGLGPFVIPPGDGKLIWVVYDTSYLNSIGIIITDTVIGEIHNSPVIQMILNCCCPPKAESTCSIWADSMKNKEGWSVACACGTGEEYCWCCEEESKFGGPDSNDTCCYCVPAGDEKTVEELKVSTEVFLDSLSPPPSHWGIWKAGLFLSRDGGETFVETLAIGKPEVEFPGGRFPFDSVKVETVMVDSVWKVRKTYLGKFEGIISYQPSSECKLWFVVYDTDGGSASKISESWKIPLISHSPIATGYNTKPLIKDGSKIHLLYTHRLTSNPDRNCLFYFHTEDTKPWSLPDIIGGGRGISLNRDAGAWVNNTHTRILFASREVNEWSNPILVDSADDYLDELFSPPSIALDVNDTVHIAYISVIPQEQGPHLHRLMYLKFFKEIPDSIIEEMVDVRTGDGNIDYAPSLVLDYAGRPHIGFRGGYAFWDREWHIEPLPDSLMPPSLASYGGNVYMLYSIGNTLFRRYGYGGGYWLGEDEVVTLLNLQAFELSNGSAIIWQDGDEISLIFWDPETGGYSSPHLLGTGNYPHTIVFNDSLNKAFPVFTQPDSEDYKVAYTFTDDPYNLAYYYLELGREEPSPFTVHRDSFADEMDIGDSLIYEFPELESLKVYRVLMELYAPCPETVTIFINEDTTEIELPGEELVGIEEDIPVGSNDAEIEIRGDDIGCKRIIIYPEVATGGMGSPGGPQEIPIVEPKIFKLYQSYPNPTTKATVIKFQIPVKTAVSLKVYDVSGRVVRTLTRAQSLKPGIYTVEWNGRNDREMKLPAGVYFYRLETKEYKSTKKLVWVR